MESRLCQAAEEIKLTRETLESQLRHQVEETKTERERRQSLQNKLNAVLGNLIDLSKSETAQQGSDC
jgi:hypothetical protein